MQETPWHQHNKQAFTLSSSITIKFFWLVSVMFLFLTKTFSQHTTAEELVDKSKNFFDLCEAAKRGVNAAKLLSQDSLFSLAKISIRHAGRDKHEHSITFGRDTNDKVTISPIINGDPSNGRVDSGWPGAFADIHNHPNDQPPSAGDLYCLVKLNNKNHLHNTRFVVTISGTVYVLYIYDLKLATDFVNKYPLEKTPGFSPRFPEPVFDDIDKTSCYFEGHGVERLTARESALAFVLGRYNSGAVLLKQDGSGNFVILQTREIISNGMTMYVANNCD